MANVAFKQEAHRLVDELPDDTSGKDLIYRAAVRADLEVGLADCEAGRLYQVADEAPGRTPLAAPDLSKRARAI